MGDVRLILGDALTAMKTLEDGCVDSIVTDPPASISFMGKSWDSDRGGRERWTEWLTLIMAECLRCLKPGHYALVWAIPRRAHWTAIALEDAGFEIRDVIHHLFGSGFPKSKGCLKPACENWILCRKPGPKVLPLQIDACRVGTDATDLEEMQGRSGRRAQNSVLGQLGNAEPWEPQPAGRWPANVIHDGSEEVVEGFPSPHGAGSSRDAKREADETGMWGFSGDGHRFGDSGSAARFFYCAKASKRDRNAATKLRRDDNDHPNNTHPTVKPTALMRYLCRLITPPGGTILDPFCGSGSTGKAARLEGFDFVGIEKEAEYHAIAQRRIAAAQAETPLFAEAK